MKKKMNMKMKKNTNTIRKYRFQIKIVPSRVELSLGPINQHQWRVVISHHFGHLVYFLVGPHVQLHVSQEKKIYFLLSAAMSATMLATLSATMCNNMSDKKRKRRFVFFFCRTPCRPPCRHLCPPPCRPPCAPSCRPPCQPPCRPPQCCFDAGRTEIRKSIRWTTDGLTEKGARDTCVS